MRKTFFRILLEELGIKQVDAAAKLGWSTARVGYLCSAKCVGFPFDKLWQVKSVFEMTDMRLTYILFKYFTQESE